MTQNHEIRDPVHGFISLNSWEWEIINHPVFQRMRRIKQLGLTEMVYPGATHTRFEHSLGVMHVATQMYDAIVNKSEDILIHEMNYDEAGIRRDRQIVRLSALLHDIGHSPFSHAGEELMPLVDIESGKKFKHEDYSAAAIIHCMKDVIEYHKINDNYHIKAEEICDLLKGSPKLGRAFIWRNLVSSQLDADRADYLLRDSLHIGVAYGEYDLHRLLNTLILVMDPDSGSSKLAIEYDGIHTAESLILARYMMFTQVYFHKTRRAYDFHLTNALKDYLSDELKESKNKAVFPDPLSKENIDKYLNYDDWKVHGYLSGPEAKDHAKLIMERKHYRRIYETKEIPDAKELDFINKISEKLGNKIGHIDEAKSSWYKFDSADLLIYNQQEKILTPLSQLSSIIMGLKAINQIRIYASIENKEECKKEIKKMKG